MPVRHYLNPVIERLFLLLVAGASAFGQAADSAYEPLSRAYEALRARSYEAAIENFRKALDLTPNRADIHKDLGYAYLKIGENELARDHFRNAMDMDPADSQVALEFAFLAYETKQQAEARRVFDRVRKTGVPSAAVAEKAFQNIDGPLAAGIARWQQAIAAGSDNFSSHFELATLAEQRDELALSAEHYEKAWRLIPDRRSVLVDLGRVWKAMGRGDDGAAALLAASRGGEPRAAEMARELLPGRYPFVPEFEAALRLDAGNVELRRELAYLLLRMGRQAEAEQQFRILVENAPEDLLAATQLGFLLYGRGEKDAAQLLFDRVLAEDDEELANRVRAVLRLPQVLQTRAAAQPASVGAKEMAERSMLAGYLKDGLKYLQVAHEADPGDFDVMLKLGWAYNILHDDLQAERWFDLTRHSPDPQVASEGSRAWENLHEAAERFRTSVWVYPMYSTRWRDFFSYGQIKTELRRSRWLQPYLSVRFIGDTEGIVFPGGSRYSLSESSFILAGGLRTASWHRIVGWFEAGNAVSYSSGHMLPDYRGGFSGQWRRLPESSGWFVDGSIDALYISRFSKDYLLYGQGRAGYAASRHLQIYWNGNMVTDAKRQYWANFVETGPGIRVSGGWLPRSMWIGVNLMRGAYLINAFNPHRPNFDDIQVGVWYAFVR